MVQARECTAAGKASRQGGGRAEPEQPTFTLHTASSLRGRGRNRAQLCKQLSARPCCRGTPGLNTLNRLCTRVRKHPPTALGSGTWERSGPGWSPTLQKDCLNLRPF